MERTSGGKGQREAITAMRLDRSERAMVDAAARLGSTSVSDLLRSIVLPEVTHRVARSVVEQQGQ